MRILYIASGACWGGASVALYNIVRGMKDKGHEVFVIIPSWSQGRLCKELKIIGADYFVFNYDLTIYPHINSSFKRFFRILKLLINNWIAKIQISKLIEKLNPDIVHTNVGPLDIGFPICNKKHIPHIWHLREYQDRDFGMVYFPNKKKFIQKIHHPNNYNIAITKGVFEHWNLRDGIDTVIYDGVFDSSRKYQKYSKEKYILYAGRIEKAKGLAEILPVFADFFKLHPDYKFQIAGRYDCNDDYFKSCMEIIKLKRMENNIQFLGDQENIYEIMAKAKALVVPSVFEGFGFITAEAMFNECYVIGRNTAGTKEQFDICALSAGKEVSSRFNTNSELLQCLDYAVNNNTAEQCKIARQIVLQKYSLEQCCDNIERYYYSIFHKAKKLLGNT